MKTCVSGVKINDSDITMWLSGMLRSDCACPTVFVYTRIYVRAPKRLRRCISAARTTHMCSLICLCHGHNVTECLCASYTITYASSSLRSLIIVFTVSMENSAGFLCTLNDQRVKTTLHAFALIWPTEARVFIPVIVIYM